MGNLYGMEEIESYSGNQHVYKQKCSVLLKMQRAKIIQNCSITYPADILKTTVILNKINLLATDFFFQILAHPVFKM